MYRKFAQSKGRKYMMHRAACALIAPLPWFDAKELRESNQVGDELPSEFKWHSSCPRLNPMEPEPNDTSRPFSIKKRRRGTRAVLPLLVVLIIVSAILLIQPRFGSRPVFARFTAARAQVSVLKTAFNAYEADNGCYPPGTNGLMALVEKPPGVTNWRGPYLQYPIPLDPWGHPFIYQSPGMHNPQTYDLSSVRSDGVIVASNWK
jgi:general secretion pathway protein G